MNKRKERKKRAVRNSNLNITLDDIVDRLSCKVFLSCVNVVFQNYEQLAEVVKSYPCLYNKQEKDFKKISYFKMVYDRKETKIIKLVYQQHLRYLKGINFCEH